MPTCGGMRVAARDALAEDQRRELPDDDALPFDELPDDPPAPRFDAGESARPLRKPKKPKKQKRPAPKSNSAVGSLPLELLGVALSALGVLLLLSLLSYSSSDVVAKAPAP